MRPTISGASTSAWNSVVTMTSEWTWSGKLRQRDSGTGQVDRSC